jgi:hypothetical protein
MKLSCLDTALPERSQSLLHTANNPHNTLTSTKNTQVGYIN